MWSCKIWSCTFGAASNFEAAPNSSSRWSCVKLLQIWSSKLCSSKFWAAPTLPAAPTKQLQISSFQQLQICLLLYYALVVLSCLSKQLPHTSKRLFWAALCCAFEAFANEKEEKNRLCSVSTCTQRHVVQVKQVKQVNWVVKAKYLWGVHTHARSAIGVSICTFVLVKQVNWVVKAKYLWGFHTCTQRNWRQYFYFCTSKASKLSSKVKYLWGVHTCTQRNLERA